MPIHLFLDFSFEVTKTRLKDDAARLQAQRNLMFVLDASLRLMHPLMPFVTEAIWDQMPASWLDVNEDGSIERAEALMIAFWPEPADLARFIDEPAERTFELARALVSDVRSTRARYRISPKQELRCEVKASTAEVAEDIIGMADFIRGLANVSELSLIHIYNLVIRFKWTAIKSAQRVGEGKHAVHDCLHGRTT